MTKDESGGRKNANAAYLARNPVAVAARWGSEETQKVGASAAAGGAGGASGAAPTSDALAQMAALEAQNKQLEKKLAQYEVKQCINFLKFFLVLSVVVASFFFPRRLLANLEPHPAWHSMK
jgi:hypothetical protein